MKNFAFILGKSKNQFVIDEILFLLKLGQNVNLLQFPSPWNNKEYIVFYDEDQEIENEN